MDSGIVIQGPPGTRKLSRLRSLPQFLNSLLIDFEDEELVLQFQKEPQLVHEIIRALPVHDWLMINRLDRVSLVQNLFLNEVRNGKLRLAFTTCQPVPDHYASLLDKKLTSGVLFRTVGRDNDLKEILLYGLVPQIYDTGPNDEKIKIMKIYLNEFIDQEILRHAHVRNLVAFHLFISHASEYVGVKLNYTVLAQKIDVDYKTVQNYFELLIGTRVGFYLPSYGGSVRTVQTQSPRFYFFDVGFYRAACRQMDAKITEGSNEFSQLFKLWGIAESHKMNELLGLGLRLSYLQTKDGVGIDLILESAAHGTVLIMFIGTSKIIPQQLKSVKMLGRSFPHARLFCVHASLNRQDYGSEDRIEFYGAAQFFEHEVFLPLP